MPFQSANFGFLAEHDDILVEYGALAERYFEQDPNTCLIKLRQFAEVLAQQAAAYSGVYSSSETKFIDVLNALWDRGVLTPRVSQLFHGIRKAGNKAVHDHAGSRREAAQQLKMAYRLAVWFHRSYGSDPGFKPGPFVPPPTPEADEAGLREELEALRDAMFAALEQSQAQAASIEEQRRAREAAEARIKAIYDDLQAAQELAAESEAKREADRKRFEAQLAAAQEAAARAPAAQSEALLRSAQAAGQDVQLDEADTRKIIDAQLREAGWEADSTLLRHAKGVRPAKGRNLAIAEWPTASGPADYVLFVGLKPVGVVEAKRMATDVPGRIPQARRYSEGYTVSDDQVSPGGPWGALKLPFLFATNGRDYLRQLESASGIWFLDARRSTNHPHALPGWYTPEGLSKLLEQDIDAADKALASEASDYLPLRDYQRDAIRAVEVAISEGRRSLLLAMATGTGKTRTAICMLYRLIKAGRFRRALFLVDRTSLGTQAHDSFTSLKLEQQQSFTQIYDVKQLGDITPESDTRLQLATIQGMVHRLHSDADDAPPVDQYDLIVVDECHRGYNLDREMSDAELTFRSEADYISKYRRVLDHFDAVKVGLTATPALHTTEIFGKPVFEYGYRQAVIDGHLVDHEPPLRIVTALAEDGITWAAGEEMAVYKVREGQLDLVTTPDEVHIELAQFNNRVQTENFNRVVLEQVARHIDPTLPGKALIFCVNDRHADLVVKLLKAVFDELYGPTDDQVVQKITGAADKPGDKIRHYKNERYPRVAVTVDLLTTGIDVPEITHLVFLRRVKSRILYEQMLGRATRKCDAIGKQYFRIYDAVDLYGALEPYSSMKPVVTNPKITFDQLATELTSLHDDSARRVVLDQLIGKLQRKKATLKGGTLEDFSLRAGMEPEELIETLKRGTPAEAAQWFAEHPSLAAWLDEVKTGDGPVLIVAPHTDSHRRTVRGFRDGERPEDYLESFGQWVRENLNQVPALKLVEQRPRELTRKQLKELKLALDEAGFTEAGLQVAHELATNQQIAASIIGFVRQQALGSPLVPYEERVRRAMDRILKSRAWTSPQRKWLERIGKQLTLEGVVDREALDRGQFQAQGGFDRLNKVFDGELEELLGEIREGIWVEEI